MDNNFNQPNNGENNQDVNQPSTGNGFNFGNSNGTSNGVNYNMGTVGNGRDIKSMVIGLVAALAVAVVGVVLYCVLGSVFNIIFFPMGAVILAGEVFIYGKLSKNLDPIGLVVCVVLAFIAIFVGTRMAEIYAIKGQTGCTYTVAKTAFKWAIDFDSASKMEYVKNIIFGYIFSIGYAALWITNQRKKRK